jgi:hypothetical protein
MTNFERLKRQPGPTGSYKDFDKNDKHGNSPRNRSDVARLKRNRGALQHFQGGR